MLIFEEENKPIVLEKQLHKCDVYDVGSYLKTEVEDLANNNNDSLNVTLYKYLNVFMQTCIFLWVCVTKRAHFPKSKLLNDEESLGIECSYVLAASVKLVSRKPEHLLYAQPTSHLYTVWWHIHGKYSF